MVRRPVNVLASLLLPALLCGVPAFAQTPTGEITGVVRDAQGVETSGAEVTATEQRTGETHSATTAADGRYAITGLTPGVYTVSATLIGEAASARVEVTEGGTVTLDLELQPLRLEAVTVTAMLRDQQPIEVPFSVAAPTESVLRARGADDIEAVAANVAAFSVQNLGPGQSQVAIRGASAGQIARDQPGVKEQVGAYLDGSVISLSLFTPDLDLFDVSRVEVLRGPQGTLFGSGSLGGAVRYITHQPEFEQSAVFGEVGGTYIDGGGPGASVKLGLNTPLGERTAARVVGYHTRFGGYMDAVEPGTLNVEDDVNSGTRTGVRAALRIAPSDRLSITPRIVFQRVDMDGWNRIDAYNILANPYTTTRPAVDLGERQLAIQIDEPFTDDFLLGDVNLSYDLGGVSLTSITSYTDRDILVVRDAGALTSSITGGSLGLPEEVYTLDAPLDDATKSTVWTQELRLASETGDGDGALDWVLGAFYSNNRREYGQDLFVDGFEDLSGIATEGLEAPRDVLFYSDLAYDLTQFAVFGEATLPVAPRFDLTAGLRYYSFSEEREQIFDGIFANSDNGNSVVSVPGSTDADGFAPRLIASYEVSDRLVLNAQAAKGFRLGGINDPLNVPLCTPQDLETFSGRDSWEDETAWNYELGAKSRLLGGRGALNVSAFYMDISDLQLIVTAGSCSSRLVFNVPEARSQGLEAEFSVTPTDYFDLALTGSYTDAELRSTLTSTDSLGNVSVVSGIEAGNRLPSVPQFQAAAAATFRWQLSPELPAFLTASWHHTGSRFTQIDDHAAGLGTVNLQDPGTFAGDTIGGPLTQSTFTFDPLLPAYNILNLRLGIVRGSWEVALHAKNLTDTRAFLALDRERGTLARVGYLTNPPRRFEITVRFEH